MMDKGFNYYQGAINTAVAMRERLFAGGVKPRGEDWVYLDAEYALFTSSQRNMQLWLSGEEVWFRNHKRDKRGKLLSCDAYFKDHDY